jgi:hypothetical protein
LLRAHGFGAQKLALLDHFVGDFFIPEANETCTSRTFGSWLDGNASIP